MPIQYGTQYKPPKVTYPGSAQAKKNTTGYRDPFPSLSGNAVGSPSRMQQQAPKAGGYGQPAKPPPQFQQQQQPAPAAPQTPKVGGYSYDSDPVLNQINALATMDEEGAQASAQNLRRQLAGAYGDPVLARQAGASESEAATAAANPDSVTAQIAHNFGLGQQSLEDQLNASNLFYSGARVRQLGELAAQRRTQEYTAANDLAAQLGGIEGNLNSAQNAAAKQRLQAQIDAAARAAAAAAAAGGTGGTPAPPMPPGLGTGAQEIFLEQTGGGQDSPYSPAQIAAAAADAQGRIIAQGPPPGLTDQVGPIRIRGGVVSGGARQSADTGAGITPDMIAQGIAQIEQEQTDGRPVTAAGQQQAAPVARQAQQQIISQGPPPGLTDQVGPMNIDNGVVSQQAPAITEDDIARAVAGLEQEQTGGLPVTPELQAQAAPAAEEAQQALLDDPILAALLGGGPPLVGVPRTPGRSGARPLL